MDCLSAGHSPAEFDAYAADYDAGMDNPLKKRLGSDAASFVEVKVDWLLGAMRRRPQLDPSRGNTTPRLWMRCGNLHGCIATARI